MAFYCLFKEFSRRRFDQLQPRITKLEHMAAIHADQVVMISVSIGFFIHRMVLPELVLGDQFALHQHIQGIVNGGPADVVKIVFHLQIKLFRIKMVLPVIDLFKYGKTFWCFSLFVLFEIRRKDIFHFSKYFTIRRHPA